MVAILFLDEQARPFLGLRLGLAGDRPELLELGHGAVALGLEGDLRLAHAFRLSQQLLCLLELGRQGVTLLDDGAQLGRCALSHLGEYVLEPFDLGAKLVALLDRRGGYGEPLEGVAELLLEPLGLDGDLVALGSELLALAGVSFLLLGQPVLLLARRRLGLGERGLQTLDLLRGLVALLAEPADLLLVCGLRLGESALQPVDVARQAVALGVGGSLCLGERGPELLDLEAKPVPLLGGRPCRGEPLEHVAELLLHPVALGCDLVALRGGFVALRREFVALPGVPLLCLGEPALVLGGGGLRLGENPAEPLELGHGPVPRLLQTRELLLALVPRLGENGLQTLDLRRCALALFLETAQVLLVRSPSLGEDCFEPLGVSREPLLVDGRGLQALELCGGVLVLLP